MMPLLEEEKQAQEVPPTPPSGWRQKVTGKVNGKPLDMVEWGTSVFNVAPSSHRLKSALGLSAGLLIGAELMKVLTGRALDGKAVSVDKILPALQPLHGKLAYNYHSDDKSDRWMRVLHNAVPGVLGAVGTFAGSAQFFHAREKASEKPHYLDEYEKRAEMVQAHPWSKVSAFSSMFSSVSGFNWLPFPNYGLSLGTRFTLASGRKVALPGAGKVWSNNHSIYPMNAPELVNHMVQYAVGNPSHDPKQLQAMAQGVLSDYFRDVTPEQVNGFVAEVKSVRDHFLREGGVPEQWKKELEAELNAHFKGAGLESTLEKLGFDVTQAQIGANGLSGKIAEKTGAGREMARLRRSFVEEYTARKDAAAPVLHSR